MLVLLHNFTKNVAKLWLYNANNKVPKLEIRNGTLITRVSSICVTLLETTGGRGQISILEKKTKKK